MTASLLPNGKQYFADPNGVPLAMGTVTFYVPGTSTPRDTWQDPGQTILNTNPVVLDSYGSAIIYGDGQYRQIVKDVDGNLIWDQLTASAVGQAQSGAVGLGLLATETVNDALNFLSALSFAPQSLSPAQQAQAAKNISGIRYVANRTAMKALATSSSLTVYLAEGSRAGIFAWQSGNFSSQVAADPLEGIYIASTITPSTAGAWVRFFGAQQAVSPLWWGAAGNGVTDDAVPLQAAMATDYPMYIDRLYAFSAAITHSSAENKIVFGNGNVSSILTMTNPTQDGLVKGGGGSLIVRDLGITTSVDKTAGSAIAASGTSKDRIDNCMIYGSAGTMLYNGISINGLMPNITFNYILSCRNAAITINNTAAGQGSEGVIFGNTINTQDPANNAIGILWTSGLRTLRIAHNTIQNYAYGCEYAPSSGYSPQSLSFIGNILEANAVGGLVLSLPAGSTTTAENVIVSGNEFNESSGKSISVSGNSNLNWVKRLNVSGNVFNFGSAAQINLQAGFGAFIDGNFFNGTASSLIPIALTSTSPNGTLFGNNWSLSVTTLYALNGNIGAFKAAPIVNA
jgi:hypothetical protein